MKIYDNLDKADQRLWIKTLNEISILREDQDRSGPNRTVEIEMHRKVVRSLIEKAELKL